MKKKKAIAGLPSNTFSVKIGNNTITKDAVAQLIPVAKGTYLGSAV
jgi:hypothetical protein